MIPSSPEQRCRSLLLFSTSLLGVLLPMLWLVPLRQAEVCRPPPPPGVAAWLARLEQRMSSALCLLRWSPPGGAQPLLFGVDAPPLAIRWLLLIVVLWALCCAV